MRLGQQCAMQLGEVEGLMSGLSIVVSDDYSYWCTNFGDYGKLAEKKNRFLFSPLFWPLSFTNSNGIGIRNTYSIYAGFRTLMEMYNFI